MLISWLTHRQKLSLSEKGSNIVSVGVQSQYLTSVTSCKIHCHAIWSDQYWAVTVEVKCPEQDVLYDDKGKGYMAGFMWVIWRLIPLLVPNVVICTENVVTHALPNLPEEKKEEEKREGKEGRFAFFLWTRVRQCMGDHILCAYYHVGHQ